MIGFYSWRDVKSSRKDRRCDECGHPISVGDPYRYSAMKSEGEFYTLSCHADCQSWASALMCSDDGRGFLRDSDPDDEYELEEDVRANPPPPAVYARLPAAWKLAVDRILKDPTP